MVKNPTASAGDIQDMGSVRKSPWRRTRQPTLVSCLENPVGRGALRATVHVVAKSWTQQNDKTILTVGEIKDGRKQHQLFSLGVY